jgi:hypothetical protein
MTMPSRRSRRSLLTAAWRGSALLAAFALIGLLAIIAAPANPGLALRANTYNQMTGVGLTSSALTVSWKNGLLNSSNKPITDSSSPGTDGGPELNPDSDRAAGTGSLSFMDSDFDNLSVTVSQTQNIAHQGITVSWTGAQPSNRSPSLDFMQMMECYGDNASGPSPEGCEYGSPGMLGTQIPNQQVTTRIGLTCDSGSTPSATSPPSGLGGGPAQGCDPNEPAAETPAHCDPSATGPASCDGGEFSIPFVPVGTTTPYYGAGASGAGTGTIFTAVDTNEVQAAYTAADGTGSQQFETLTNIQASGLGCGEAESNGQTRNCWLVIVPRGTYEPNGFKASNSVPLFTSPLSAGNWAQRIQIHLDYDPLNLPCVVGSNAVGLAGTQVAYRAVNSWLTELDLVAKCAKVYQYTAGTEGEATTDLQNPTGVASAGLAFTSVPIGSEAARAGLPPPKLPTILYAPVAVTAIDFGFNVNTGASGELTTPVNLTPSLLAKAITQVYPLDLPDFGGSNSLPGPTWAKGNPLSLLQDPAFHALNSELPLSLGGAPTFPFITGDRSSDNQRIWQWIQSDPATASWLDGGAAPKADPVTADPAYVKLKLGASPEADQFDEAYAGELTCMDAVTNIQQCAIGSNPGYPDLSNPSLRSCTIPKGDVVNTQTKACDSIDSENLLPVEANFDASASEVLSATDPGNDKTWDPSAKAADGSSGWFDTVGTELPGETFLWTVSSMPDVAAYGLLPAALCNPAGADCLEPSTTNVAAALKSAKADSAGLLEVNPAKVPSGAYPLTEVIYAAVPTDQPAATLTDYADFISYAASTGQTPGTAPGDLPPGYLPLTSSLKAQAQTVAAKLIALARKSSSGSSSGNGGSSSSSGKGGSSSSGGNSSGGGSTSVGGGSTSLGGGATPTPAASSTCTAAPAASTTPTASTSATASPTAKASATATASASPTASATPTDEAASTTCASSSPSAQPFSVLPPSAQAAAGTTQNTPVGKIRTVLIIVLIIGVAGAVPGTLLRYWRMPRRGRRPRGRPRDI